MMFHRILKGLGRTNSGNYSGFPKETPELKFGFGFFSFSHSLQCAKILLMSTWHGVMADGEEFMRWKISTNTV